MSQPKYYKPKEDCDLVITGIQYTGDNVEAINKWVRDKNKSGYVLRDKDALMMVLHNHIVSSVLAGSYILFIPIFDSFFTASEDMVATYFEEVEPESLLRKDKNGR